MARFNPAILKLNGGPGFPPRHFWSKAKVREWEKKQAQRKQRTAEQRLNAKLRQMLLPAALSSLLTGLERKELKRRLDRLAPLGPKYQRLWEQLRIIAKGGEPDNGERHRDGLPIHSDRSDASYPGLVLE